MTFDVAKDFIDYLFDNRKNDEFEYNENTTKGLIIDFIGGEPLLQISLIRKICDYFEEKLLKNMDSPWLLFHAYSFSSNGVDYFNPEVQDFLDKYQSITSMSITIDGCKELHDMCRKFPNGNPSYDICIKAALDQLQRGHDTTKITLSPDNVSYVFEGFKNMVELGFKHIHMNSIFEDVWKYEDSITLYNELIKIADYIKINNLDDKIYFSLFDETKYMPLDKSKSSHPNYCGSNTSMIALDYKGDIFPCVRFIQDSIPNQKPYIIGNYRDGIGYCDDCRNRLYDLKNLTKENQSEQKCLNCPIESGCAWCTAYNYSKFGTINKRATYICDNHKMAAKATKYYLQILGKDDSKIILPE